MKAPSTLRLKGTVAEVVAELRRRANRADAACLASLASLLLLAAACQPSPERPACPPGPAPYHEPMHHGHEVYSSDYSEEI